MLLVQAALAVPAVPLHAPRAIPQDSIQLARLRGRMEGQRDVRVRLNRDYVELTRPTLLDSAIAYHEAWFDRLERQDSSVPNPLPLAQVSAVQVRGKAISVPAMVLGGLALGVSVLGSTLLQNAIDSRNAPDGRTTVRVTLFAVGIGAALGGAQSAFSTRWLTVYRR
jgi:hypothetical protein